MNWADYKPYKYARCSECTLLNEPGPCLGEGDPKNAKLIYISEKPGREEVNERPMRPMVGGAGRVLNRQLTEAGIRRAALYITNVVKCRCPGDREPTVHECACCAPLLDLELSRVRADTVLLAGAVAFRERIGNYSTLSPDYHPLPSLFERLGCVEQRDGRKWIGTIHPAFIMRMSGTPFKQEAIDHLRKAYALSGGVNIPLPVVLTHPTDADITRHKNAARAAGLYADDVEAVGYTEAFTEDEYVGDTKYIMDICGFSALPYESIVLDRGVLRGVWSDIWSDTSIIQAEHNGESDRFHLEQISPQLNKRFDTMYAHHMLHSNMYKYLKPECVRTYTNLPYYNRDLEKVSRRLYNGMDCIATLLIARRQFALMKADTYTDRDGTLVKGRLWDLYWGTAFPGEPGLGELLPLLEEQRRFGTNTHLRRVYFIYKALQKIKQEAERGITKLIGPGFNWQSYAPGGDVQNLFYKRWKLPIQYKKNPTTHQQKITCDKDARLKLREWIMDPKRPSRALEYEEAMQYFQLADDATHADTYMEFLDRIGPDGRFHAHWKAHAGALFRIQSKPNLQNFPEDGIYEPKIPKECPHCGKETKGFFSQSTGIGLVSYSCKACGKSLGDGVTSIRSVVLPDDPENDLIVSADFDQAELWPYAVAFDIKWLLDVYKNGDYIYGAVFEELIKKPFFSEVPPGVPRSKKYMRADVVYEDLRKAKMAPLGYMYGRQPASIASQYHIPLADAEQNQRDWFGHCPEFPKAHAWLKYKMEQDGFLRPPPGFLIHFPQVDLQGLSVYGQCPAAYLLLTSMILINQQFKGQQLPNTRIMLSMHDSVAINVGGGRKDPSKVHYIVETILQPILTRPCAWLKGFQYRCSMKVGGWWDWEMQDYDKWKEKHAG